MYKLFLTLRYLTRKWIAVFAMLSVWLCVAMVLIVFSVMDGFLENIKQHSRGLLSDIIVDVGSLQGFPYYEEFTDYLHEKLPDTVDVVTPVIYNYGILRVKSGLAQNTTKTVRIVAIDLDGYAAVNTFDEGLYYEKYYPDMTTLGPVQAPIAGIKNLDLFKDTDAPVELLEDKLRYELPPDLESAFARYRARHPDDSPPDDPVPPAHAPHGVGYFVQGYEKPTYEGKPMPGIIIGMDVIYERRADGYYERVMTRGEEVVLTMLPMTRVGTLAENPVPLAMRLVDESRTRVYQIDSICVYADFALIQRLLSMDALERADGTFTEPRTTQLLVQLHDGVDPRSAQRQLDGLWTEFCMNRFYGLSPDKLAELPDEEMHMLWRNAREGLLPDVDREDALLMSQVGVETWEDRQQGFISAVEKEKVLVTILFLIISVVAIVLIGVIFHMIVMQKTRDIGIIKSFGATRTGVASIFLLYGAAVGVVGGVLGVVSGCVFVHYINEIQDLLAQFNPNLRVWSPDVYTFDQIPNVVKPMSVLTIFVSAVFTSMLGATLPAIKAARVWPVEALRYE